MPEPPLPHDSSTAVTTQAAGQSVDAGRGRIFPCDQCGADLLFHIGQQKMQCPFCGYVKDIDLPEDQLIVEQDFHAMLAAVQTWHDRKAPDQAARNEVRCESCGANVEFIGSLTSSECPYCASPLQRDDVHLAPNRIPVDGVLPFLIDHDAAERNLRAWVQSRWFAPNDFRKKGAQGRFNGVYLPFWTYDSLTANRYTGQRGEHYWVTVGSGKNRRRVRRTRWYPASGAFQRPFDDVLVLAAHRLNRELMLALEPWPLHKCVPFNQQMLAGFFARTYEVELDGGFQQAKARMEAAIDQDVRQRIGGDTQRVHSIQTHYGAITFKHLLLPVWLLAYRYHDKPYQVMINATTGEVQGERPYSWIKITLAVLAGLVVAAVLALLFSMTQQ